MKQLFSVIELTNKTQKSYSCLALTRLFTYQNIMLNTIVYYNVRMKTMLSVNMISMN